MLGLEEAHYRARVLGPSCCLQNAAWALCSWDATHHFPVNNPRTSAGVPLQGVRVHRREAEARVLGAPTCCEEGGGGNPWGACAWGTLANMRLQAPAHDHTTPGCGLVHPAHLAGHQALVAVRRLQLPLQHGGGQVPAHLPQVRGRVQCWESPPGLLAAYTCVSAAPGATCQRLGSLQSACTSRRCGAARLALWLQRGGLLPLEPW